MENKTIGIYKSGKKVYFYENEFDHASWSAEVTNIAKIFVAHGHHVIMLSETDLINEEHLTTVKDRSIDVIYVFNGMPISDEVLDGLKQETNDIRLIITDLALVPEDKSKYTHIYTQSENLHEYGYLEQNCLFDHKHKTYAKDIDIYFGGTERGRLKKCIEYLWRPNVIWKGKSAYFNFNNYIPFHEHIEMLKKTKYTIIIGDESYDKIGFVTPRFYECAKYNVIPFVDKDFDKDELIIPMNSWLRVNNFHEMMNKIHFLEKNVDELVNICEELKGICTQTDLVEGNNIYNELI